MIRKRWIEGSIAGIAAFTGIELCSLANLGIGKSIPSFLIYALCIVGAQRVARFVADVISYWWVPRADAHDSR